jgi:hypothetical protein
MVYFVSIVSIVLIVTSNVYFTHELISGISERDCSKTLNWIVVNGATLMFAAVFSTKTGSLIRFFVQTFLCSIWMSVSVLCLRIKNESDKNLQLFSYENVKSKTVDKCI